MQVLQVGKWRVNNEHITLVVQETNDHLFTDDNGDVTSSEYASNKDFFTGLEVTVFLSSGKYFVLYHHEATAFLIIYNATNDIVYADIDKVAQLDA